MVLPGALAIIVGLLIGLLLFVLLVKWLSGLGRGLGMIVAVGGCAAVVGLAGLVLLRGAAVRQGHRAAVAAEQDKLAALAEAQAYAARITAHDGVATRVDGRRLEIANEIATVERSVGTSIGIGRPTLPADLLVGQAYGPPSVDELRQYADTGYVQAPLPAPEAPVAGTIPTQVHAPVAAPLVGSMRGLAGFQILLLIALLVAMIYLAYLFLDSGTRGQFTWPLRIICAIAFVGICGFLVAMSNGF